MYTTTKVSHKQICSEMLQLVLAELAGASAQAWVSLPSVTTGSACLDVYTGCSFRTGTRTETHVLVEYDSRL